MLVITTTCVVVVTTFTKDKYLHVNLSVPGIVGIEVVFVLEVVVTLCGPNG